MFCFMCVFINFTAYDFRKQNKLIFVKIIFKDFHIFLSIHLTLIYIFIQNKPCSNQRVLFLKPML